MSAADVFRFVTGASVVYVVMAACSGSGGGALFTATPAASADHDASTDASDQAGGGSLADSSSSFESGLTNPVPDANAAETAGGDASGGPQSGSRLKGVYFVGSDGSRQFARWVDSARNNETCTFQVANDGSTRCMPLSSTTSIFADSKCTTPLYVAGAGTCALPSYVTPYTSTSSCVAPTPIGLYLLGAAVSPQPTVAYVSVNGACSQTGTSPSYAYYAIGALVPAASFVEAQLVQDP